MKRKTLQRQRQQRIAAIHRNLAESPNATKTIFVMPRNWSKLKGGVE